MRWRIPLVAVLALFVAASCDQQPLEPDTNPDIPQPTFDAEHRARTGTWDVQIPVDLCGYDVANFVGTGHAVYRGTTLGPDGQIHYNWHETFNLTGIGYETGEVWRFQGGRGETYAVILEGKTGSSGPEAFSVRTIWNIIGTDGAPSFKWISVGHYTINANGELVSHGGYGSPLCD